MKYYNTINASNVADTKKSSNFTIYADIMDVKDDKLETELQSTRRELEGVQSALNQQTQRCRQLVTQFSKKLQSKELQIQSERHLRDAQLTRLLRALLLFEARLVQEQKHIRTQLKEKDAIIQYQQTQIKKLQTAQCNHCPNVDLDNFDIVKTDSSSDLYASICSGASSHDGRNLKKLKRLKKCSSDRSLSSSNDDEAQDRNVTSERIENLFKNSYSEHIDSLHGIKRVETQMDDIYISAGSSTTASSTNYCSTDIHGSYQPNGNNFKCFSSVQSESDNISIENQFNFDCDNQENWYASNSDQDDDTQCDLYKNNPVLECMNQILLQNINDTIPSPPKSPPIKSKTLKRVKFFDENSETGSNNYYETPIQNIANVYEVPQSIYSNDYEQILINQNDSWTANNTKLKNVHENDNKTFVIKNIDKSSSVDNYYYVDMDTNTTSPRKAKLSRTPPALPPKPANLLSKYKIQNKRLTAENLLIMNKNSSTPEPDYCSISELKTEINASTKTSLYDQIIENAPNLINDCQQFKTPSIPPTTKVRNSKSETDIPKLPQVSEIIIPSESSDNESKDDEQFVTHDNYIKNNSKLFKYKTSIGGSQSVSSLITTFNNQNVSELNKRKVFTNFDQNQNCDKQTNFDQFDLSQNFEEFNLDDCEITEEYHIDLNTNKDDERISPVSVVNNLNVPSVQKAPEIQPLPIQFNLGANSNNNNNNNNNNSKTQPITGNYEHFLECTGLSSKSILTPSRLLSNHKNMLKPKDVKLRNKVVRSTYNTIERQTNTIKYYSEPYL